MSSTSAKSRRTISPEEQKARLSRKNTFISDLEEYTKTLGELFKEEQKNIVRRARLAALESRIPHLKNLRTAFENSQYNDSEKRKMKEKNLKKKEKKTRTTEEVKASSSSQPSTPKLQKKQKKASAESPKSTSSMETSTSQKAAENIGEASPKVV